MKFKSSNFLGFGEVKRKTAFEYKLKGLLESIRKTDQSFCQLTLNFQVKWQTFLP
jgi:hypothetical protein